MKVGLSKAQRDGGNEVVVVEEVVEKGYLYVFFPPYTPCVAGSVCELARRISANPKIGNFGTNESQKFFFEYLFVQ